MPWDMGDGTGWGAGWWMLFGSLLWIAFWGHRHPPHRDVRPALGTRCAGRSGRTVAILKQRYARGEINRTEYERMRRDLGD